MKKTIFVYIIFAFLLTSFTGCGKLMDIVGLNQSEPSNTSIRDLTNKEIKERAQQEVAELLERELTGSSLMDILKLNRNADLQAVVDYRNKLVGMLIEIRGSYYEDIVRSKRGKKVRKLRALEKVVVSSEPQNSSQI